MCRSSASFGMFHDLRQRRDGTRILPLIDVEARECQLRLIGIGRARVVLDEAFGDLPRLGVVVGLEALLMSPNCAAASNARSLLSAGNTDSRRTTPRPRAPRR